MRDHKRVLVLQHAEPEHLGQIAEALAHEHVEYSCLRADLGQSIPATLEGYHGLIVMGGPQSVYEEERFPFLREEKSLVHQAVMINLPILGVCLGSQIIAEVLGAKVYPGNTFELGWKKVRLSSDAVNDPMLNHLPPEIVAFHWHGDIYDLPKEAKSIGSSDMTPVQGFSWGKNIYGFLFHLEMTGEQIAAMIDQFPDDVSRGGAMASAIMSETADNLMALRNPASEVFRHWSALL